jgi:hypothetical protein
MRVNGQDLLSIYIIISHELGSYQKNRRSFACYFQVHKIPNTVTFLTDKIVFPFEPFKMLFLETHRLTSWKANPPRPPQKSY